ncbi:cupin domain-containing protein [Emticicia sp. BO119]|uniref:cupin domain-containing protein n=1 Tax=Emticicia sp. BO119 TaxID=2757768 RepID=UPI0015F03CFD|nr:cupin domain-containing protein [Emticicia sp. BO119]MBA4850531.1 cupin domain-containing protein [Emticicia sp. BO119]
MNKEVIQINFDETKFENTTHGVGEKFIFCTGLQCESPLTQAAIGTLISGEFVAEHMHPTMEEFFYFINGHVDFLIAKTVYTLNAGAFIKVPSNTIHSLKANQETKFLYWGVATQCK